MNKIKTNLDKNKTYVLACSYGPDSMALLRIAEDEGLNVVVAHVNYHHRDAANSEETALTNYCKNRKIECFVKQAHYKKIDGNFEAWAREVRYSFFAEIAKKTKADAVLVAHQQDDLIETYLMQQKRGNYVKNWGIAEKNIIKGVEILRPLLGYSKKELQDFCDQNGVPYSIDITNLQDDLERNKIRHLIVEKMSKDERTKIIKEIENKKQEEFEFINPISVDQFCRLTYEETIQQFEHVFKQVDEHKNISKKLWEEIKKSFLNKKENTYYKITKSLTVFKCYNSVYFVDTNKLKRYNFKLEKNTKIKSEFLEINLSKNYEERGIDPSDFPLLIKPISLNDYYKINNYKSRVNRLFIGWKMPVFLREVWPGIYNNKNELIYTPRYREKFVDNHKSTFKININYFLFK